jgi:hypothetical protein
MGNLGEEGLEKGWWDGREEAIQGGRGQAEQLRGHNGENPGQRTKMG